MSVKMLKLKVKQLWRSERVFAICVSLVAWIGATAVATVLAYRHDNTMMRRVAYVEDIGQVRELKSEIVLAVNGLLTTIATTGSADHESKQAVSDALTRQVLAARVVTDRSENPAVVPLMARLEEHSLAVRRDLNALQSMADVKAFMEGPLEDYIAAETALIRTLDSE